MALLGNTTLKVEAPLESGTYSGKIEQVKEVTETKFGKAIPFIFVIDKEMVDGEWDDLDEEVELQRMASTGGKIGPKSILYQIASAAVGRNLEEGEPIDSDDLLDKRLVLTIEKSQKGDNSYSNIKSFSPWKRKAAAAEGGKEKRKAPELD